ncbi:MAG TPA: kelch repeat-containing protein [Phycisphaerales bacterium]|nr:kelch repeat-containing protein [Phycisphaerales bacterium]
MAYDAARDVTVLFGGHDATGALGETWEWNGTVWAQRLVTGPSPRALTAMAYDSARGVTVLFGGYAGANSDLNGETWEWNGIVWTQRTVSGPTPRAGHAVDYDTARGVTVLFSGDGAAADTWEWNGTAWTQRPVVGPSQRGYHAMVYDTVRGVTILFGGNSDPPHDDTWEWNGTAWSQQTTSGPSARYGHAMTYDVARGVIVLAGGVFTNVFFSDTWELGVPCIATAPVITAQPVAHVACPNGSASFTIAAAGSAPLIYHWQIETGANQWQTIGSEAVALPCGGAAYATPLNSPTVRIGIRSCLGMGNVPQHWQVRCILSDRCGSIVTSNEATYTICPADFNCSNGLEVQDIFDFLNTWLAGNPRADFNGVHGISVTDIFEFLDAWLAGCS